MKLFIYLYQFIFISCINIFQPINKVAGCYEKGPSLALLFMCVDKVNWEVASVPEHAIYLYVVREIVARYNFPPEYYA